MEWVINEFGPRCCCCSRWETKVDQRQSFSLEAHYLNTTKADRVSETFRTPANEISSLKHSSSQIPTNDAKTNLGRFEL